MSGLRIARGLELSLDYVTKTAAILAQRRKGKTYTGSVIAEEFVRARIPFVALDPTGAWWGLRASADGTSAGLPVVVIGGQHGDLPLERSAGALVANLVLDHPGHYVLDLSLLESRAAEREFATAFALRLHRRKMQPGMDFPLHLFVDEADLFVPQEKEGKHDVALLGAYQGIVRRGGLHGLGVTLISQRPALVNKNVLTQLDILILLRLISGNDQDAVEKNYLRRIAPKDEVAVVMDALATLPIGTAWVCEPGAEPPIFGQYEIRTRRTFNSSATPKQGEKRVEPKVLAAVDLDQIRERMASAVERQKQEDPVELRRQVAALQRQLAERPAETVTETIEVEVIREVPVVTADALLEVSGVANALTKTVGELSDLAPEFAKPILAFVEALNKVYAEAEDQVPTSAVRLASPPPAPAPVALPGSRPALEPVKPARPSYQEDVGANGSLSTTARKILEAIVRHHPAALTPSQVALSSQRKARGGSWNTAVSELRRGGYIQSEGATLVATPRAFETLGIPAVPLGPEEQLERWREALPTTAASLFDILLDVYPNRIDVETLAARTARKPVGGSWNTAVSTLVRNDLAERNADGLRATDWIAGHRG